MSNGRHEEKCWPAASTRTGSGYSVKGYKQRDITDVLVPSTGRRRSSFSEEYRRGSKQCITYFLPPKSNNRHEYPEPVRIASSKGRDWEESVERQQRRLDRHSVSQSDVLARRDPSYSAPSVGYRGDPYSPSPLTVPPRPTSRPQLSYGGEELLNILVVGGTGVGKSELISQLADPSRSREKARVGHALMSCTSEVASFPCICDGIRFNLIDSPGFDDTRYSDGEVLAKFAQFFRQRSAPAIHGVIFMHRISDTRLSGSAVQTAEIIKHMCGRDFKDRIVLVTTMWDRVRERRIAERREDELLNHPRFWREMYDGDQDRSFQFSLEGSEGGSKSARNIVRFFLKRRSSLLSKPVSLQLAKETQRGQLLESTAAGASILGRHDTTPRHSAMISTQNRHSGSPEKRYSSSGIKVR